MTVLPAAPPVNFNLAVESLRQTLRREQDTQAALSQAIKAPKDLGRASDGASAPSEAHLGRRIDTSA